MNSSPPIKRHRSDDGAAAPAGFASLPHDVMHRIVRKASRPRHVEDTLRLALVQRHFRDAVRTFPWSERDHPGWFCHLPAPRQDLHPEERRQQWLGIIRDWYGRTATARAGGIKVEPALCRAADRPAVVSLHLASCLHLRQFDARLMQCVGEHMRRAHRSSEAALFEQKSAAMESLSEALYSGDESRVSELVEQSSVPVTTRSLENAVDVLRTRSGDAAIVARGVAAIRRLAFALQHRDGPREAWWTFAHSKLPLINSKVLARLWADLPSVGQDELYSLFNHASSVFSGPSLVSAVVRRVGAAELAEKMPRFLQYAFYERQRAVDDHPYSDTYEPAGSGLLSAGCGHFNCMGPVGLFGSLWRHPDVLRAQRSHGATGRELAVRLLRGAAGLEDGPVSRDRDTPHERAEVGRVRFNQYISMHVTPSVPEAPVQLMEDVFARLRVPVADKAHRALTSTFADAFARCGAKLSLGFVLDHLPRVVGGPLASSSFSSIDKAHLGRAATVVEALATAGCIDHSWTAEELSSHLAARGLDASKRKYERLVASILRAARGGTADKSGARADDGPPATGGPA